MSLRAPRTFRALNSSLAAVRPALPFEEGIAVAASGGPDSTALAIAASEWGKRHRVPVRLIYVHNHLVPEDDQAVQALQVLASRLDVDLEVIDAVLQPGSAIEERARDARMRVFSVRREVVLTGHTADDQAETIWFRMGRGTGLHGLGGIRTIRRLESGWLVHPLLHLRRREVHLDLEESDWVAIDDPLNHKLELARARIREKELPTLERFWSGRLVESLVEIGGAALRVDRAMRKYVARYVANGRVERRIPTALVPFAIQALLEEEGAVPEFTRAHYASICEAMSRGKNLIDRLPGGRNLFVTELDAGFSPSLPRVGNVTWVDEQVVPEDLAERDVTEAWIDPAAVRGRLRVRFRRDGDRFRPFGMNGHQKLKKFFNAQGVPPRARDCVPLLVDDEGILWVAGYRPDERVRVSPETTRAIRAVVLHEVSA